MPKFESALEEFAMPVLSRPTRAGALTITDTPPRTQRSSPTREERRLEETASHGPWTAPAPLAQCQRHPRATTAQKRGPGNVDVDRFEPGFPVSRPAEPVGYVWLLPLLPRLVLNGAARLAILPVQHPAGVFAR